ncbi:thiamine pyrophosphate-binding protein [Capilliphycus salinus ALCB114379]|uniref:thiamine pyrophosphate-binding protein n=1 Tax=Capilliphycus salinus TaxID=2768948 RepID=UPI0039A72BD1
MRIPVIEKPAVGSRTTTVGEYLVSQLEAVGVGHVFGVPGDYVLDLMDMIVDSSMQLVGTCNELNAGYAGRRLRPFKRSQWAVRDLRRGGIKCGQRFGGCLR